MGDDALLALAASPEVRAHLAVPNTGVYIVRPDGHIVWASPSMEQVTGRGPEDLVGRNGWDVFVAREDLPEVARFRALLSESDGAIWMALALPDGSHPWFRIDTALRAGGIVCAFRRESDATQHRLHYVMRPRPRSLGGSGH